jgi:CheY-like chemotaxis protein/HPt (histidine-containing phosphotransfer) domain-containing protein
VTLLSKYGHSVFVANNGRQALEAFENESFDVILMDLQMPEMGGLEATAAIRAREQGTDRHTPIIAMTAHAMAGDKEKCLNAGMDGYVSKPIKIKSLLQAIQEVTPLQPGVARVQTPKGNPSMIEKGKLLAELDGDGELLSSMAHLFLADISHELAALRAAIEVGNAAGVASTCHTLKGSLANFSAHTAVEAVQRLEITGRREDLSNAHILYDQVRDAIDRLKPELAELAAVCPDAA